MAKQAHLRIVPDGLRACGECQLRAKCLPDSLGEDLKLAVTGVIRAHTPVPRGTYLFRQGAPMKSYFLLRSGSAKSVVTNDDGQETVMSFLLPSDLIGTGSMDETRYHDSVVTLERSSFCEIRSEDLSALLQRDPAVQKGVLTKVANRISTERHARVRLGHASADERVADFLVEFSERMSELGRRPDELFLAMSRHDIASYLGLASETVSRVLTRFADAQLITVKQKHVTLLDRAGLLDIVRHGEGD